ncbi:OLC1v1012349C1 [Oldenlandia corymbosa var. corymbosa]|uniref:OLC1v1012349C1 n=1 Tax=Oldenlandia corymbosa var. corymbosa TaxID=529605 RepID=A0AAV1DZ41_OLDCO|nr:OLC1v1012349C1 [Oldenlandia corymbosa var. corymbosa]
MVKHENFALFSKSYATPGHQGGLLQSYGTPGGYRGGSMPNSSGSQAQTDWWGTQKGPNHTNAHSTNVVDTPLESENPKSASNSWQIQKPEITQNWLASSTAGGIQMSEYGKGNWQNLLSSLVQAEVGKLLKGKGSTGEAGSGFSVKYAHLMTSQVVLLLFTLVQM